MYLGIFQSSLLKSVLCYLQVSFCAYMPTDPLGYTPKMELLDCHMCIFLMILLSDYIPKLMLLSVLWEFPFPLSLHFVFSDHKRLEFSEVILFIYETGSCYVAQGHLQLAL